MEKTNHASGAAPRRDPAEGLHYRKNKYAAPVGGIFLFLAAVGLVAVGIFCVRFTQGLLDNTREKQKFEQIITPVLMFDPLPFENPSDVNPLFLLQSSLWSAMLGEKRASYQEDPLERVMVPASDVDVACARLYGPDVRLEHQTFTINYVDNYVYDEETRTYYVPVTGQVGMYTPSVERVVKKGDVYTLTVGYLQPTTAWTQATADKDGKPEADKYMIYELRKVKDHYRLTAIRDLPSELLPEYGQQVQAGSSAQPAA